MKVYTRDEIVDMYDNYTLDTNLVVSEIPEDETFIIIEYKCRRHFKSQQTGTQYTCDHFPRKYELMESYAVEFKNACYCGYGEVWMESDDGGMLFEGYVCEDGTAYEVNSLKQFFTSDTVDIVKTNDFCAKNGFLLFPNWCFDLEIAIYWDGSNWNAEIVGQI